MSKSHLKIDVRAEGTVGRIDIIGSISEWGSNNATDMRQRCQDLKDAGVTSALVYLMTEGGDVFQANEIYNILIEVFGSYTAEGGALVASAGSYLAVCASDFTMARNGQLMIHKPYGSAYGNETEIENRLKLLKNLTLTYYNAYVAKLAKTKTADDFKSKWDTGDFWMTADEGKEWGFVTAIKEPVKIDQQMASMIAACGAPIKITPNINPNLLDVDLKTLAVSVGLPADATEDQVNARIAENKRKAGEYDTLSAQVNQQNAEKRKNEIKAKLDIAEKKKLFKADERSNWQSAMEKDFDGTCKLLDGLAPVVKPETTPTSGVAGSTYKGKTFEQLQSENPDLLLKLQDDEPDTFEALFADYKTRNRI